MKKRILLFFILLTAAFTALMPFDAEVYALSADYGTCKVIKNTQSKTKAEYSIKVKDLKSGKDSCSADIIISGGDMSQITSWELTFETNFNITKITGARLSSRDDMKYTLVNNATPLTGKPQSIKIHIEGKKVTKPQIKKLSFKASEKDSAGDKKSNTAKKPKAKTPGSDNNSGRKNTSYSSDEQDYYKDTDGDGLFDAMEDYLGTDKNKADTDNDGLPDQYEYSYSPFLDPLKADSDNDTDKDGLTNKQEYKYKTDPLNKDTDQDDLSDYLEIKKYGTDPLKRDTDGDKLNDGTEIRFGLDPKKTATNGTPDNQRIFSQHIPQDSSKFARYNDGSCPYKISVDMKAAGDAEGNIYVMKSGYSYSASSYVIGKMLEFSYNDDLPVKEFKLSFELDESILDNTVGTYAAVDPELKGIKRFEIFYIPKRGSSMPVSVMTKTEYDTKNNTVYITANCMGTYYLVDMEIYYKELGIEPGDIKKSQKN